MDWIAAKDAILVGLASGICLYIANQIRLMADSIQALNIKIAQVLGEMKTQQVIIEDLTRRVNRLEDGRQ